MLAMSNKQEKLLPQKKYFISESTCEKTRYDVYISGEIAGNYFEVVDTLRKAATGDEVHMFLNSEGGELDTAYQIINAIEECSAEVTTYVDSKAHSAATLIFLAGHIHSVAPTAFITCHYWVGGAKGKANALQKYINFYNDMSKNLFKEYLCGFLKEEEFEKFFEGEDFFFNHDEICHRLEQRNKFILARANKSTKTKKTKN